MERDAVSKSEYFDGEIFAMAGATSGHSLIATNIRGELRQRLKGRPCNVYDSDMRLKVIATELRTYSDISVYCGALEYDLKDPEQTTALNPSILFEVLSPSTEEYDRGFKGENYRQIESLRAYILVAQDRPYVEIRERPDGGNWSIRDATGLDAVVMLAAIGVELPLAEIYYQVKFRSKTSSP